MGVPPPQKNTFTLWIGLCQDWWLPLPARPNPYTEAKRDSDSSCLPLQLHPFTEFCPHAWSVSTHSITSRWFICTHVNWVHLLLQAGSSFILIINTTWHLQKIFQLWKCLTSIYQLTRLANSKYFHSTFQASGYLSKLHPCSIQNFQHWLWVGKLTRAQGIPACPACHLDLQRFSRPITPSSRVSKEPYFQGLSEKQRWYT